MSQTELQRNDDHVACGCPRADDSFVSHLWPNRLTFSFSPCSIRKSWRHRCQHQRTKMRKKRELVFFPPSGGAIGTSVTVTSSRGTRILPQLRSSGISLYWNGQLVCTPASTALFACPSGTVSRLYRHIRQAAIPARVVLGTATRRASRRPL